MSTITLRVRLDSAALDRLEDAIIRAFAACPAVAEHPSFQRLAAMRGRLVPSTAAAHESLQAVLADCAPHEVTAVRDAVQRGDFDGRTSMHCLFGIIARERGLSYRDVRPSVIPPIESWVVSCVWYGMMPETSEAARLLDGWLSEWLDEHTIELAPAPIAVEA